MQQQSNPDERELIDTLWNVNSELTGIALRVYGINRYIMECKSETIPEVSSAVSRINRYIMECKSHNKRYLFFCYMELIDTLWNVNQHLFPFLRYRLKELIDTLWNVNVGKCVPSTRCLLN